MIVAVASGKGGTGKTTLAVNLALVAGDGTLPLDCDVEEPNVHLFLRPVIESSVAVSVMVPGVDEDRCTGCGRCGEICRYSAIVSLGSVPIVFPELCHGCRGCLLVCEQDAMPTALRGSPVPSSPPSRAPTSS